MDKNIFKKCKVPQKRRHWVTLIFGTRDIYGGIDLLNDLPDGQFQNFCRMSFKDFEYLLSLIELAIRKQDTNYRDAISPKERLVITLRFMATGDSFSSLMYTFKVSKSSVSRIVQDVCRALKDALKQYVGSSTEIATIK